MQLLHTGGKLQGYIILLLALSSIKVVTIF